MCGRYSLAPGDFSEIRLEFQVDLPFELAARYNIAPTWSPGYEPPIVVEPEPGRRELALARWWMIPATWRRPLQALPTAFNARAEELEQRAFWSRSFDARRCLVPSTGWREFRGPSGRREAHQFHLDRPVFAFAGLWDEWEAPDGQRVRSFAIVTVPANDVAAPIHDRMPLVVPAEHYAAWLNPELAGAPALAAVQSAGSPVLHRYQANPKGNDVRAEGPECIAPLAKRQGELF